MPVAVFGCNSTPLGMPRYANGEALNCRTFVGEAHVIFTTSLFIDGLSVNWPLFTVCHLSSELLNPTTLYANYTRPLDRPPLEAIAKVMKRATISPVIEEENFNTFPRPSDFKGIGKILNGGHLTSFLLIRATREMMTETMWITNIVIHYRHMNQVVMKAVELMLLREASKSEHSFVLTVNRFRLFADENIQLFHQSCFKMVRKKEYVLPKPFYTYKIMLCVRNGIWSYVGFRIPNLRIWISKSRLYRKNRI